MGGLSVKAIGLTRSPSTTLRVVPRDAAEE
jgi:hypothetical protein